jgi:hypothetical protein
MLAVVASSLKPCSACGIINPDDQTVCSVCGNSLSLISQLNEVAAGSTPVRPQHENRNDIAALLIGILLALSGIGLDYLTVTTPSLYNSTINFPSRYGGPAAPATALFVFGILLVVLGWRVIAGQLQYRRNVGREKRSRAPEKIETMTSAIDNIDKLCTTIQLSRG